MPIPSPTTGLNMSFCIRKGCKAQVVSGSSFCKAHGGRVQHPVKN